MNFLKISLQRKKKFDLFSILEHYQRFQENAQNCVYYNYEVKNGRLKASFKTPKLDLEVVRKAP